MESWRYEVILGEQIHDLTDAIFFQPSLSLRKNEVIDLVRNIERQGGFRGKEDTGSGRDCCERR